MGGGHEKNMALERDQTEKFGFKGGSPKNPFKFCSDSVCNNVIMQTA